MATFSEKSLEAVTSILQKWAEGQLKDALSKLSAQNFKSSGNLEKSLKIKIANEGGLKARVAIEYLYYGTILDRDFIKFTKSGGKGVSTSRIEDWLKNDGLSKMGGYKGKSKNLDRQIRETAWAIRRSWEKEGGRRGRKWNFRKDLETSSEELTQQIFDAFQEEAYESILLELSQK